MLEINGKLVTEKLTLALKDEFKNSGFKKAIIGLSGGIDSAAALYLTIRALGKENIMAIKMPYKTSSEQSVIDADRVIEDAGIEAISIDITPAVKAFENMLENPIGKRLGNIMARIRMITLFDYSAKMNSLVIGTSNKSELLLGYGTLFGDLACSINPLGSLYKTQVYEISKFLGVPTAIINKAPSADLEKGQTDEKDFGFTYKTADTIFDYIYEQGNSEINALRLGFDMTTIKNVLNRVKVNKFKSKIPIVLN